MNAPPNDSSEEFRNVRHATALLHLLASTPDCEFDFQRAGHYTAGLDGTQFTVGLGTKWWQLKSERVSG